MGPSQVTRGGPFQVLDMGSSRLRCTGAHLIHHQFDRLSWLSIS